MTPFTLIRRVLLVAVAAFALVLGAATTEAHALNPSQTTVTGVVNNEYWDLANFWRTNFNAWGWSSYYYSPGVRYFNNGPYNNTQTSCGVPTSNSLFMNDDGVYCGGADHAIYINYTNLQGLLDRQGDGAAAFLVAHEFGHHIQSIEGKLGWSVAKQKELNADCLAGMYFRWAISYSGLLDSADYVEAQWGIYREFGGDVAGHGTASDRLAWFKYGYTTYDLGKCNLTFSSAVGAKAASNGPTKKRIATRVVRKAVTVKVPPIG